MSAEKCQNTVLGLRCLGDGTEEQCLATQILKRTGANNPNAQKTKEDIENSLNFVKDHCKLCPRQPELLIQCKNYLNSVDDTKNKDQSFNGENTLVFPRVFMDTK